MKTEAAEPAKTSPISKGLLMAPATAGYLATVNKHKRAGSTGTTGDESCSTDEDDNVDIDEADCSIKDHVTGKLFATHGDFGSFSDIATITDKLGHSAVMHRNSSDSSVYSDLGLELENVKGIPSDGEKSEDGSNGWVRSVVEAKEQAFARLQDELKEAHQELKLRDEEVGRLSRIRQDVEAELEDLTASLFQVSGCDFCFYS